MRRQGTMAALAVWALPALLAGGCTSTSSAGTDVNAAPTDLGEIVDLTGKPEVTIDAPDNTFKPRAFKVSAGTKIIFRNTGANVHNATPNDEGMFEPVSFKRGESASIVAPQNPRTYRFYCTLHGSKTSGQRGAFLVAPRS